MVLKEVGIFVKMFYCSTVLSFNKHIPSTCSLPDAVTARARGIILCKTEPPSSMRFQFNGVGNYVQRQVNCNCMVRSKAGTHIKNHGSTGTKNEYVYQGVVGLFQEVVIFKIGFKG